MFQKTSEEFNEDYIIVRGLMPGELFEFSVVAVDGDYMTESEVEEIEISNTGECVLSLLPGYGISVIRSVTGWRTSTRDDGKTLVIPNDRLEN
jgi:hypothetical protein